MAETVVKEIKGKEWLTQRDVLWILVFLGFAVNYMIRINLNIAIVAMVKPRARKAGTSSECIVSEILNSTQNLQILNPFTNETSLLVQENMTIITQWNETETETNGTVTYSTTTEDQYPDLYDWNEYQTGLILGAFFWLHWLTQVPGGLLAQKYGTKLVFGLSNFGGVLFCFVLPVAAYWGWEGLIAMRLIQGLVAGFSWPAMHTMTAKWIPPNERGKFVTAYLGSSVGTAVTYPMCGYIIEWWGWEYVFYVNGVMGTLWFLGWWFFVFDSPAQHPRISPEERHYIETSLGHSVNKKKAPVPWKSILTSVPVWMNILAQWGGIWGLFTLMTHAPTYFKHIHGWNIRMTGMLSGMPHLLRMLFAYLFSLVGDYLLRSNKMTRTNVRKLATGICTLGQACFMLALAFSGCNAASAVVFLTLATGIHGSVSSGPLASLVDISPNYAGVTLGLANSIVAIVGFCTPAVTGAITYQNQTVGQWQLVFLIAVGMLVMAGVAYCLFSRSELEPWNTPDQNNKTNDLESELTALKHEKLYITEKEKL